jgi:polyisoprenyl-phosphate glycosyltransferase
MTGISYIVPVYNEEGDIVSTIDRLRSTLESLNRPYEIIVVDDGSDDNSASIASACKGVKVLRHPTNAGYGAALKTGISNSQYDWIGIVDADGTYEIEMVPQLVASMEEGFDMVVAARSNVFDHDGFFKKLGRKIFVVIINILINQDVQDPNSGLRIFTKSLALTFFPFLCNSFSFTTSITVFALGDAYFVKYLPSEYKGREGASKVKHFRDTLRTIQLIVQGVTFFNPLKLYLLLALVHVVFVALPSLVLLVSGCSIAGWIYLLTGTVSCLLVSIGALGDIFRISAMRSLSPPSIHVVDKDVR